MDTSYQKARALVHPYHTYLLVFFGHLAVSIASIVIELPPVECYPNSEMSHLDINPIPMLFLMAWEQG